MKFSTPSLFFALVGTTTASQFLPGERILANLKEKWSIADPTVVNDGLGFTFDYPVSNYIDQGQAYYEVYDGSCMEGGTKVSTGFTFSNLVDVAAGSVTDDATFDAAGKTARVPINIKPETIASDTDVYTATNDNGAKGATIVFCVRFGLKTLGGSPIEVNFLESIVTVTVDLSAGFDVDDINVEPKDQVSNTATQTYEVDAYMCESGSDTAVADSEAALSQGSLVTICVKPNTEAIADGIKMQSIDSFEWTRDSETQVAIESGVAAANLLTTFDEAACDGGDYCQFSSILFAAFYSSAGQVTGSGVSSMQFANRRSRDLRQATNDNSIRALQQTAATSEFDMTINIRANDDGPASYQTAAGTTAGTVLVGALAFLGAVAVL